jgi:uncharacterized membrane protein
MMQSKKSRKKSMSKKNRNRKQNPPSPNNRLATQQNLPPTSYIFGRGYSGPIPPPESLEKYEKILPGLANRIMTQAENQTSHRIEIENKVIDSDIFNSKLGLIFGFVIGLVGLLGGFYMVYLGKDIGWLFSGGTLVGLVSIFVYGRKSRASERKQKREEQQKK